MLEFFRTATSRRHDDGASAVEYGLLVAGIAAVIVLLVFTLGNLIKGSFQSTCDAVKTGSSTVKSTC